MPYRIHIVTLPGEEFWEYSYLIRLLCELWRGDGHSITVGPVDSLDADIGILHIDRTWIPEAALPKNPKGRPLLNGEALDISKRRVSGLILNQNTNYEGPVIIKTNANCFGIPDQNTGKLTSYLRRLHQRMVRVTSWQLARRLEHRQYPVLEGKKCVPKWVWKREELIVEKFIPEIEGELYILRLWIFFGDREYGVKMWGNKPVVKSAEIVRYEYIDNVPDEIRDMRVRLGFDFGKFDYVIVDGKPILIDANKTPWITSSSDAPSPNLINLAKGIHSCIGLHN